MNHKRTVALETSYGGCRFRSRLEARWAVFFDAIGVRWSYEYQGYLLGDVAYLPDFLIHDWDAWVEIKGEEPTDDEIWKCRALHRATGQQVLLIRGSPGYAIQDGCATSANYQVTWWDGGEELAGGHFAQDRRCPHVWWYTDDEACGGMLNRYPKGCTERDHDKWPCAFGLVLEASRAAMGARFESGDVHLPQQARCRTARCQHCVEATT